MCNNTIEKAEATHPLNDIVTHLDNPRHIVFYGISLAVVLIFFLSVLYLLYNLPSFTIAKEASDKAKSILSQQASPSDQTVEALRILSLDNTSQTIIVGAKILTVLTLGIVLIVALSRIITTRYRTIATLYGMTVPKK